MSAGTIGGVKTDSFSADLEHRGKATHVRMRGNADMAVHESLKAFLDSLGAEARTQGAKEIVFELQELYFMNSSCLSLLLRFINAVLEAPPAQRYAVRFRSNPNLRWQKKSLHALHSYAKEVVVVE
jgi:anti-anti-sigma factor